MLLDLSRHVFIEIDAKSQCVTMWKRSSAMTGFMCYIKLLCTYHSVENTLLRCPP